MAGQRLGMGAVAVLVVAVAVLAGIRLIGGGAAPTPAAFASHASLDDALAAEEGNGKPVLAFATADWCGPCQAFKRGALADERVTRWIGEHANAAFVDLTDDSDPKAREGAQRLGVSSIPSMVLLVDGEIVSRLDGGASADALLAWLEQSTPAPTPGG